MYVKTVADMTDAPNSFAVWKWIRGTSVLALLSVTAMVIGSLFCPGRLSAQESKRVYTRTQFDEAMKEVWQFKFDQLTESQQKDTENWFVNLDEANFMLHNMAKAYDTPKEELRSMLFEMMERMGHDDSADLRLQIGVGTSFHPSVHMKRGVGKLDELYRDRSAYFHSSIAEAQVRDWCQHPEKVEREVWFQVWIGMFPRQRGGSDFMSRAQLFDNEFQPAIDTGPGSAYWFYARMFVFSACVTNRRELYAGIDPTQLQPQYIKWRDWLHSTVPHTERWRASGNSPTYIFDPEGVKRSRKGIVPGWLPKLTVVPKTPYPTWGNLPAPDPEDVEACW